MAEHPDQRPHPADWRRRWPFAGIAIVGVLALIAVWLWTSPQDQAAQPCTGEPVQINVQSSPEKASLMERLAAEYTTARRSVQQRCAAAAVFPSVGSTIDALACGWDPKVMTYPRPDAWSPASSAWVKVAQNHHLTCQGQPTGVSPTAEREFRSIARSPLVVAMPRPMAKALGWPHATIGWRTLLDLARDPGGWAKHDHPEWGRFRLGKTNPRFSTSGLHATIATFYAATDLSSDLTLENLREPKIVDYVRGVESSVMHYGETTLTFLRNLYEAGRAGPTAGLEYISAVTVEEKSVLDFNRGDPDGASEGKLTPPTVPLVAVYPDEGTVVSDNPYLPLQWPDTDPVRRAVAEDFQNYLLQPQQQAAFRTAGFRSADNQAGPVASEENGLLPERALKEIRLPSGPVLAELPSAWQDYRRRANILMVIDVSGSMNEPLSPGGVTRLEAAKQAAVSSASLSQLADDDRLGLWAFSSEQPGEARPWRQLVEPGPVAAVRQSYLHQISQLKAVGGTALYFTIREAQKIMLRTLDSTKINAIVLLSDGANQYREDENLDSLVADLAARSPENSIRVFPIAYGTIADRGSLEKIAKASRAKTYQAIGNDSLEKVLAQVVSNF